MEAQSKQVWITVGTGKVLKEVPLYRQLTSEGWRIKQAHLDWTLNGTCCTRLLLEKGGEQVEEGGQADAAG